MQEQNWPEYRGPESNGHSRATGLPTEWSETKNVRWRASIPGVGFSSPVIWGKQIWLTSADPRGYERRVLCYDRESGKLLVNRVLFATPDPESIQNDNSYASPSPAITAGRVYCHFGSVGTICLDTKTGKTLWERRDLPCKHSVGPASSPFLVGERLILTFDGIDLQYLIALDARTGKTLWKTDRSYPFGTLDGEERKAFTTPVLLRRGGKTELVSLGARAAYGYDIATGKELWRVAHRGYSNAARPVIGKELMVFNSGFNTPEFFAVRIDNPEQVVWRYGKGAPTMSSPTLVDDLLYFLADSGFFTCVEFATGAEVYKERIGERHYASPLYADGKLYLFADSGRCLVVQPGRRYQLLAENQLDSNIRACPAAVGRSLIVRGRPNLYRIELPG